MRGEDWRPCFTLKGRHLWHNLTHVAMIMIMMRMMIMIMMSMMSMIMMRMMSMIMMRIMIMRMTMTLVMTTKTKR